MKTINTPQQPVILVNAANCGKGGGVQVADGFIRWVVAHGMKKANWVFALSSPVSASLGEKITKGINNQVFLVRSGDISGGGETRRGLLEFEKVTRPDAVFTIFGPSYVKFKAPEFSGFANPFALFSGFGHYHNHPLHRTVLSLFKKYLRAPFLRRPSEYWVETAVAKEALARLTGKSLCQIHVVPNCVNPLLSENLKTAPRIPDGSILCLAAAYWHKNHRILPKVAALLEADGSLPPGWRFVVTLDPESEVWREAERSAAKLGVAKRIQNVGVVSIEECAKLYSTASLLIHPSLLEVFSATYLEAMLANVPLLVSDRPFAREICGDAALYFDPLSPASAAVQIRKIFSDGDLRRNLTNAGAKRHELYPSADEKNAMLAELVLNFAEKQVRKLHASAASKSR